MAFGDMFANPSQRLWASEERREDRISNHVDFVEGVRLPRRDGRDVLVNIPFQEYW